jgi:hypothetical protein
MDLLTFDMDINALWEDKNKTDTLRESESEIVTDKGSKRGALTKPKGRKLRMLLGGSMENLNNDMNASGFLGVSPAANQADLQDKKGKRKLVLPTGPALYNANVRF